VRAHHRSHLLPALALVAALVLSACGSGGGTITATGEPQPAAGSGSGGTDESGSGSDAGGSGSDGSGSEGSGGVDDTTDLTIPDLGDSGACVALGLAYASSAAAAIGMTEDVDQLSQEFEQYKGEVPEELRDDLDVVEQAFATMQQDGLLAGGEAMSSPEFEQAQANIEAYLNDNCGGAGF